MVSCAEKSNQKRTDIFHEYFQNPSLCFMETIETKILIILRHSYLFEMKTNFSWRAVGRFARGSTKQASDEVPHGPWVRHPSACPEIRPLLSPSRNLAVFQHLEHSSAFVVHFSLYLLASFCPHHLVSGNLTLIIKPRLNGDPVRIICILTAFPRTGRPVDDRSTGRPDLDDLCWLSSTSSTSS